MCSLPSYRLGNLWCMPRIRAASISEHKLITRALILDTAQELFSAWGYQDTSFGDIAGAVGIGRTTLYDYFTDKDDLLASLVEERLPTVISDLVSRVPDDIPPADRLCDLVSRVLEFIAEEPTLGLLLHREVPKLSEAAQDRVANAHQTLAREFVVTYQAGVREGDLKELPPGLAGRFMSNMIMSAAQVLIDAESPADALPIITHAMTDLLFHGLARRTVDGINRRTPSELLKLRASGGSR